VDLGAVERQTPVAIERLPAPFPLSLDRIDPNPASTEVRLRLSGEAPKPLTLQVFDLLGRVVRTHSVPAGVGTTRSFVLDVRGLASGTYVVRLQAAGTTQVVAAPFTIRR